MKNKGLVYALCIILVVVLLIFGILYGWFRSGESLTPNQTAQLEEANFNPQANISVANEEFSKLWMDHVSLTREVIVSEFNKDPQLDEDVAALLQNQKDIAKAVDLYYPGSYNVVANLFTEHITFAKEILDDLRDLRILKLPGHINRWYTNSDLIAEAMITINPNWHMKSHMHSHLRITEREAVYEWLGMETLSKNIYTKKIEPQAQAMAEHMSSQLK